MEGLILDIFFIFVLIIFNGFFTGSEIAIISIKKVNLDEMIKAGKRRARLISYLKQQPDRFFATVQIGVTLLSTLASVYGGSRLMRYLDPYLKSLALDLKYIEEVALLFLVLIIAYLSLVFGELIPKSLALRYATRFSMIVAYPLYFFSRTFSGFTFFLTFSSNLVLAVFQKGQTSFSETRLHEEEIREILQEGVKVGAIEKTEHQIISNVFGINDTSAREVMTPRVNVKSLSIDLDLDELDAAILQINHNRIPVFHETLDKIRGVLYLRDYMTMCLRNPKKKKKAIESLIHPPYYVPESMKIDKILKEMQKRRTHLAIVVDEYGGTSGIITMEDILEEIVGEIQDISEQPLESPIVALAENKYSVLGTCSINEFNEYFDDYHIPESKGYNSIAGFIISKAERFPEVGEMLKYENLSFELLRRIRQKLVQFRLYIRPLESEVEGKSYEKEA